MQFTVAKIVSTVGMFLVSWMTLVVAALAFVLGHQGIPHGSVPIVLILAAAPFVGFCVIAGVSLVSESEGAMIAATIGMNTSYGFCWYLLVRNPVIRAGIQSPKIIWSREVLTVLGFEFAVIVLVLGLTFYLQSRKRDFV